jgi:hypothetical protein
MVYGTVPVVKENKSGKWRWVVVDSQPDSETVQVNRPSGILVPAVVFNAVIDRGAHPCMENKPSRHWVNTVVVTVTEVGPRLPNWEMPCLLWNEAMWTRACMIPCIDGYLLGVYYIGTVAVNALWASQCWALFGHANNFPRNEDECIHTPPANAHVHKLQSRCTCPGACHEQMHAT